MAGSESVYDSRRIANYLVGKSGPRGLTALQVMKLTYIAHGFMLGFKSRPLLEDDVEAWRHGPVMRRIYHLLPGGNAPIIGELAPLMGAEVPDDDDRKIIDMVFNNYGTLSGLHLSSLTHSDGSPWRKTWDTYGKNAVIPQDLIEQHYKGILRDAKAAADANQRYVISAF